MNIKVAPIILFQLVCLLLNAQNTDTLNQTAYPFGGVNELALHYFSIDFTKAQRQQLKDTPLEFIFLVDEKGTAKLREINGTSDIVILDSLERHSAELPKFQPALEDGRPIPSLYFMQLTFPTYKPAQQQLSSALFGAPAVAMSEFEYVEFSKDRLDMVVGFTGSTVFGNAKEYLKGGFGMQVKFSYTTKSAWGGGLNFGFDTNKHKKDFPIDVNRAQNDNSATAIIGVYLSKWLPNPKNKENPFSIQLELNYVNQNVTPKIDGLEPKWVKFTGFSPGLFVHYPLRLFKAKRTYHYGPLLTTNGYANLHFGVRQFLMSNKAANRTTLEIGFAFRMTSRKIVDYQLKEN